MPEINFMNKWPILYQSFRRLFLTLLTALLAMVLPARSSQADVTLFTERAAFNAAAAGLRNIDFEGLVPSPSGFVYYPDNLTRKGVIFRSVGCDLFVTGPQYSGAYEWNSGAVLTYQNRDTNVLDVSLPDGITAVGSDIMTIGPAGHTLTVVLSTGETYNVPTARQPQRAFMGLVSSTPITSLKFSSMSHGLIDNFVFGQNAHASAKVTMHTDRNAFRSMLQNSINIDFEGIAPRAGFREYGSSEGLWIQGVNFVGVPHYIFRGFPYGEAVVDPAFYPPFYDWGSGAVLNGSYSNGQGGTICITLPDGINAVGSDIMTFTPYGATLHVTLSTGDSVDVPTSTYPNRAFVGFTSSIPIKTISFRSAYGTELNLDNFVFGRTAISQVMLGTPRFVRRLLGGYYLSVRAYMKGNGTISASGRWIRNGETYAVSSRKRVSLSPDRWTEGAELQIPWDSVGNSEFDLKFRLDTPTVLETDTIHAVVTGFRPDVNGWGFDNQRTWAIVNELDGLCLGMVSTARGYFVRGIAIPMRANLNSRINQTNIMLAHWGGNSWIRSYDFPRMSSYGRSNTSTIDGISEGLVDETYGASGQRGINGRLTGFEPCVVGIMHSYGDSRNGAGHAVLATSLFQCPRLYDDVLGREKQNIQLYAIYDPNEHDQFRHMYTSIIYSPKSQIGVTYVPDDFAPDVSFYSDYDFWFEFTGWWEPSR